MPGLTGLLNQAAAASWSSSATETSQYCSLSIYPVTASKEFTARGDAVAGVRVMSSGRMVIIMISAYDRSFHLFDEKLTLFGGSLLVWDRVFISKRPKDFLQGIMYLHT